MAVGTQHKKHGMKLETAIRKFKEMPEGGKLDIRAAMRLAEEYMKELTCRDRNRKE